MARKRKILAVITALLSASAVKGHGEENCSVAAERWLERHSPLTNASIYNSKDNSITLDWSDLNCSSSSKLSWRIELYGVDETNSATKRPGFGTRGYFEKYDRCRDLEADIFYPHSSAQNYGDGKTTLFQHVLEKSVMLRICTCDPDRSRRCDCRHPYIREQVVRCSSVLEVPKPENPEDLINPLCVGNASYASSAEIHEIDGKLNSPILMGCDGGVRLSGHISVCTRVQVYDIVTVNAYKVEESGHDEYPGFQDVSRCSSLETFSEMNRHPNSLTVKLERSTNEDSSPFEGRLGGVHGFVIPDLDPNSTYCVMLEMEDHPFCSDGGRAAQRLLNRKGSLISGRLRRPSFCSIKLAKAIRTPACPVYANSEDSAGLSLLHILLIILFVLVSVIFACIVCFLRNKYFQYKKNSKCLDENLKNSIKFVGKKSSPSNSTLPLKPRDRFDEGGSGATPWRGSSESTSTTNSGSRGTADSTESSSTVASSVSDGDGVFLLAFPESEEFDEMNLVLGKCLESLGKATFPKFQTYNISDPDFAEHISRLQEVWLDDVMHNANTRIVVVASPLAAAALERSESVEAAAFAPEDPVVRIEVGGRLKETLSNAPEDDDTEGILSSSSTDNLAAISDAFYSLRVNALRSLIRNYSGNYRKVVIVEYGDRFVPAFGKKVFERINPHQNILSLPEQTDDLTRWLTNSDVLYGQDLDAKLATFEPFMGAMRNFVRGIPVSSSKFLENVSTASPLKETKVTTAEVTVENERTSLLPPPPKKTESQKQTEEENSSSTKVASISRKRPEEKEDDEDEEQRSLLVNEEPPGNEEDRENCSKISPSENERREKAQQKNSVRKSLKSSLSKDSGDSSIIEEEILDSEGYPVKPVNNVTEENHSKESEDHQNRTNTNEPVLIQA